MTQPIQKTLVALAAFGFVLVCLLAMSGGGGETSASAALPTAPPGTAPAEVRQPPVTLPAEVRPPLNTVPAETWITESSFNQMDRRPIEFVMHFSGLRSDRPKPPAPTAPNLSADLRDVPPPPVLTAEAIAYAASALSNRMIIRCENREMQILFVTENETEARESRSLSTVRFRFDDGDPLTLPAVPIHGATGIGVEQDKDLLDKMIRARRMLVEYIPVDSAPKIVAFELDGLYASIKPIEGTCGVEY